MSGEAQDEHSLDVISSATDSDRFDSDVDEVRQSTSGTSTPTPRHPVRKKRKSTAAATGNDLSKTIRQFLQAVVGPVNIRDQMENDRMPRSDEHYAFAMLVYNLMKDMKPGPACDLCRIKIQQTIMEFKYHQHPESA